MDPTSSHSRSLIIDTDAGVDDAIALLMALKHSQTRILAITTVNGNVGVAQVTTNVCLILDQTQAEIPVYRGCRRPLIADPVHSESIHGEDGLGNATKQYPLPLCKPDDEHAALALSRLAKENSGNFTLLTLGPLTNIALALRLNPGIVQDIPRLVMMGGAVHAHGNASPSAEYNILADPEAASIVFDAGFSEIWLMPWETTLKYPLLWDQFDSYAEQDTLLATFFKRITNQTANVLRGGFGLPGFLLPDPLAAAVALSPKAVTKSQHLAVNVEISGNFGRGMTSVDWSGLSGKLPNAHIVVEMDEELVFNMIGSSLI